MFKVGIIFVNSVVLLAGFVPRLRSFMFQNFVMSTYSSKLSLIEFIILWDEYFSRITISLILLKIN